MIVGSVALMATVASAEITKTEAVNDASYMIKKNKTVLDATPSVAFDYNSISDYNYALFSGTAFENDTDGNARLWYRVAAEPVNIPSKGIKDQFTVSVKGAVRSTYDLAGETTNKSGSKTLINDTYTVADPAYIMVNKNAETKQTGLLAKYVVRINRVIERTLKNDKIKTYTKRLAAGAISVYSRKDGSLFVKTSGVVKANNIVEVYDANSDDKITNSTATLTNKDIKAFTKDLDSVVFVVDNVEVTRKFWVLSTDNLYIDTEVNPLVIAKQSDAVVIANNPQALTVVPEPATLALLGLGGVLAFRKRR